MKFFKKAKDGGPDSTVTGYWLFEIKRWFSIAILRFDNGSRDSYHGHAFNSLSWLLCGTLQEQCFKGGTQTHRAGLLPILTRRTRFHRVFSEGTSWVLTFRGPWSNMWLEYDPRTKEMSTLTNGRKVIDVSAW